MRWNNLALDAPVPPGALPLAIPGAVERTFDSPGFAGMTFYEIQARSIISRVPKASRMPFEYTINPYRGCSHSCVYCLGGETPILMAGGATKPLADVRVGDRIYGTEASGACRRYVETEVLAHWQTVKPAYRVTLRDGTAIIASGDHRFLAERGWKHVTGAMSGTAPRPYLTTFDKLVGTGAFAEPPKFTGDYRLGYLCAMLRGGVIGRYNHREALERARCYLRDFGVPAGGLLFSGQELRRGEARAIRCQARDSIDRVAQVIAWPTTPDDEWHRGFLAGIVDAEGHADGCLRISHSDPVVLQTIEAALDVIGVQWVRDASSATPACAVRLLGGVPARLRFLHSVAPAITGTFSVAGAALDANASLDVVSIEPLRIEIPMYDITTGTGDFIANGVVSHNCFARNTHTYLDLDAGRDFDTKVVVKLNATALLRKELAAPRWTGAHIAMGTNVDCYQRAEGRYRLMRGIIAALRDAGNPFSILTKGTLITRDLDLLREAATVTSVGVSFSVGFVDDEIWRGVEPGAPSPRRRLEAVRRFADAGFAVHVLMAPILPGLTDTDESIDATVAAIAAAGATGVSPITLHLRPGAREWYAAWLARTHPQLVDRYRSLFGHGSYAPKEYQREISDRVAIAARSNGIGRASLSSHRNLDDDVPPIGPTAPAIEQLTLL